MQHFKYVILGGGMVAGYAAQEFAKHEIGPDELMIISADDQPPYERPPLTKEALSGKRRYEDVLINDPLFYDEHRIGVWLETWVTGVNLQERRLMTEGGEEVGFEKLLIATGANPRRLDVPGADSPLVYTMRSMTDSRSIQEEAREGRRALVIGASFIAMETAAVLAQRGLEVTMVYPGDRVWSQFFTPEMSAYFEKVYRERGVRLLPGRTVARFHKDARALHVELSDGARMDVDFAVAGVGVAPVVDIFRDTPLRLDNGVVVNEYLETNVEGVYAAGDVANWRDVIYGKQRRVEHWDNAVTQGPHVARVMMGKREPYVHVPYFFSDEFDLSYEFWGETAGAREAIHRGDVAAGRFSTWWVREDGCLAGAFVINRPDEEREFAQRWTAEQKPAPLERLRDESLPLAA